MLTAQPRSAAPMAAPAPAPTNTDSSPAAGRHAALRAYRTGVAVRAVAAIGGGYVVAALAAAALALYWPGPRVDGALTGTLAALAVYPCAAMWSFAAPSAARAWLGLLAPGAALAALVALAPLLGATP